MKPTCTAFLLLATVYLCAACGASTAAAAATKTLDELNAEIAAKETMIDDLNNEIDHAECCATKAKIEAMVARARTDCLIEVAEYDVCAGRKTEGTSELYGCMVGHLTLHMPGGAPMKTGTIDPCADVVKAGVAEWPVPECAGKLDQIESTVLAEMGLDAWPECKCVVEGKFEP